MSAIADRVCAMSRSDRGAPAFTPSTFASLKASRICEVDSFLFPVYSTSLTIGRSSIVTMSVTPPPERSASIRTFSRSPTSQSFWKLPRIVSGSYGSPTLMPR